MFVSISFKNNGNFFNCIIMLRFANTKVAKEKFYGAKRPLKIWDVGVNNIVTSIIVGIKTNSKCFIGHLDKVIRPLVLILPKMSGNVKTLKVRDGGNGENNKLMSFCIDDEKYKTIWTKIEDLKKIELNALLIYDNRYIKTKIRIYGDKDYTNFHGLNVPEDNIECKSFIVISNDSCF